MTTEEVGRAKLIAGAAVALALWFGGMAAAALVVEPRNVIVFAPRALRATVDADGLILTGGRGFVVARSQGAGFVRRLYRSGAWLVWPSVPRGCLGTPAAP